VQKVRQLLRYFVSGLLVLLPAVVTVWLIGAVATRLVLLFGPDSRIATAITEHVGIPGLLILGTAYLLVIAAVTGLGYLTSRRARNFITVMLKAAFSRFPIVDRVYGAVEQVVNVIRQQGRATEGGLTRFGEIVLVRFANVALLAVLTSRKVYALHGRAYVQVLLPHSPMPVTGFLYMIPTEDTRFTDLNIEEFTKVTVSFGSLTSQVFSRPVKTRPAVAEPDPDTGALRLVPAGEWE